MPVTDKAPYVAYDATGGDTYPFEFKVLDAAHLVLIVAGVQQVQGIHYAANIAAGPAEGGSIVFEAAHIPAAGVGKIEIARIMPLARSTDYQEAGGFRQAVVDKDFDYLLMLIQQLNRKYDSVVQLLSQEFVFTDSEGRAFTMSIGTSGPDDNQEEILYPIIRQKVFY